MDTDNNLATLAITIHFPLPDFLEELPDFRGLIFFWVPLLDVLKITSSLHIITCNFGSLELKPTPSLPKDCRKLSLISPTDTDSIAPCKQGRHSNLKPFYKKIITKCIKTKLLRSIFDEDIRHM